MLGRDNVRIFFLKDTKIVPWRLRQILSAVTWHICSAWNIYCEIGVTKRMITTWWKTEAIKARL